MRDRRTLFTAVLLAALVACAPTVVRDAPREAARADSTPSSDAARDAVVYALSLIGAPYRNGGVSPETGFDCSGFVWYVHRRSAGLALPRSTEEMARSGRQVDIADLQPGDLVFYNTLGRDFSHVGIYIGEQRFVHAPSTGGAVEIVPMGNRYWSRRLSGARRVSF